MRPHLDYGDVIFDKACNNSFQQRLESLKYNRSLAITGAVLGSSSEMLYPKARIFFKIDDDFENFASFSYC